MPETAAWNVFFGQRSERNPVHFDHMVTELLQHASGNAATARHEFQPDLVAFLVGKFCFLSPHKSLVNYEPLFQFFQMARLDAFAQGDVVEP